MSAPTAASLEFAAESQPTSVPASAEVPVPASTDAVSTPTSASAPPAAKPKPKPAAPAPGSGKLLKADTIADLYRSEVQAGIQSYTSLNSGERPKLVGILYLPAGSGTETTPSEVYAEFTRKTCEALGVEFVLRKVGGGEGGEEGEGQGAVEDAIIEANRDDSVRGIMVYYPIFGGLQDHYLQQVVSPAKDVEGLNVKFHYNLYHNIRFLSPLSLLSPVSSTSKSTEQQQQSSYKEHALPPGIVKSILPCTPLGIIKSLEHIGVYNKLLDYGDRAYGRTVTVINRSEVVGRPLAALLANDGARVFSVDIDSIQEYTKRPAPAPSADGTPVKPKYHTAHIVHPSPLSLEECLALSDVVISAVPSAKYKVPTAWLKQGCVAVNVASEKNFETSVREKASIYLPAVGKVTILMLLRNLLRLCEYQKILAEAEQAQAVPNSSS